MRLKIILYFPFLLLCSSIVFAQDTSQHAEFSFSAYVDAYIATYSDSLGTNDYQKYTTISPRSNQFGLNVAMFTAKYSSKDIRGVATIHFGDIPRSSWSGNYNFIQEANVGVRLCKNLWLDAGFFRTHIGTEACFPKENYTSSLAITTYFEPYYQSGFRLNYNPTEKLSLYAYALNGYNIYEDNNKKKSAGLLATYVLNDSLNVGYSGYYGDDAAEGSGNHFRTFHNIFLNYKGRKIKVTVGADFATQQHADLVDSTQTAFAMGAVLIASYNASNKFRLYTRGELFKDTDGFLSGTFTNKNMHTTGLKLVGFTLGAEYKPTSNSYIRLEGRNITADNQQEIFHNKNKSTNTNTRLEAMLHLGFWLG